MFCARSIAALILAISVCNVPASAEIHKLRADFSNSDPGAKLDVPRHRTVFDELSYLANTFYGRATVLTVKNSQFLGQPLLAKLNTNQVGAENGSKYDYYLLSMQFNIPTVRNIPLNKYRYVRFDSIFSIQAPAEEFRPLYNSIVRMSALRAPMAFPLNINRYFDQRSQEVLGRLEEIDRELARASAKTNDPAVRISLKTIKEELRDRKKYPVSNKTSSYNELIAIEDFFSKNAVPAVVKEKAEIKDPIDSISASLKALSASYYNPPVGDWKFAQRQATFNNAIANAKEAASEILSFNQTSKTNSKDLKALEEALDAQTIEFAKLTGPDDEERMAKCVDAATQLVVDYYKKADRYKGKSGVRNRVVYGNYRELENIRGGSLPWNFNVISIHPTNEVLDVKFQNVQTIDVKAEPKYMEFSGASASWNSQDTTDYNFKLPRVVGITNHFGAVSWTYYPAKRQPVMLGNKTTFAILQVNRGTRGTLRLNSRLNYELMLTSPFVGPKMYDEAEVSLDEAVSLEAMLRLRCAELSSDTIGKLFGDTFKEGVRSSPELITGENQPAMIKFGRKFYRFSDDKLNRVEFDDKGDITVKSEIF